MALKARYSKKPLRLTSEDIKKKLRQNEESDAYMFDVEYQKLKLEQERLEEEYEREREKYLRISEELREEMLNGTASEADMARFMSALTDKGVELQQEQARMQETINDLSSQREDVEEQMNALRKRAFAGSTTAYQNANNNSYEGFKVDSTNGVNYANAKIVDMTPQEYLRRVAFGFKNGSMDELVNDANPSAVERYMRQMLRGTKYGAPSINYSNGSYGGTERALAAVMNGYKRIPVMIVE